MAVRPVPSVTAETDLVVRVARDAAGDLVEGARTRLERAEGVESVDRFEVTGVRPGLNDLRVTATATVRVRGADDRESVAARLAAGFGLSEVTVRSVRPGG
jgi:Co/Zn/Cd efflux system component